MGIRAFLKSLISTPTRRRPIRRSSPAFRPQCEALEDRCLLSGIALMPPIDFATNATPSSVAFNAAAGDQVPLDIAGVPRLLDGVAVGHFDHDENLDVAQTNVIAGSVSIFLGVGHGGFAPAQTYQVGLNPISIVAGDLNRDGNLDLVVADFGSNDLAILFGKGDGTETFHQASFIPLTATSGPGKFPRNVAIGEFDGNGIPDLAVAEIGVPSGMPGGVAILTGHEDGSFTQAFINLSPGANYVAVGDFNGDGLDGFDDLAVGVGTSPNAGDLKADETKTGDDVLIFLNDNGTFGPTFDQPIRVGATPRAIAVADLNGDQHLDLAVLNSASADVTILMGDGQGYFASKPAVTTGAGVSVAVGDFNDDGIPDLVTANFFSSTVSVLQGNRDGTFQPAVEFWAGNAPTGVAVGHFDSDHRVDVVAGRLRTDQLSLLLNDSPQPGDGVGIDRDIPYGSLPTDPTPDPLAAHHKLDVYSPPEGTASFAGEGQPYPVVFFVHGGGGTTGDKSAVSYLMRSLARQGIVAVSINYRLTNSPAANPDQIRDAAHAFAWASDHVSANGGDPNNIFAFGHSSGATLLGSLGTESTWLTAERLHLRDIRGVVQVGGGTGGTGSPQTNEPGRPPSLLLTGTEGQELAATATTGAFYAASSAAGAEVQWEKIPGRDHFTLLADMALADDPARQFMLDFIDRHLIFPDLQVSHIVASHDQLGKTITLTATVANTGANDARPSLTEFRLDDGTLLGLVDTPAIAKGGTATVTLDWKAAGVKGQHVITVTADRNNAVRESNETNNTATLTVTIKGNKVTNGSFEQANASGTAPAGWSGASTAAGTASWNAAGSVSFTGTGGSVLLSGSPTWTSAPVTPGEQLLLMASVSSIGASSGATVSLAYFDAAGHVLGTVPVLSVPLTTSGLVTLQQQVMAPLGAASVRIVLTGFAASDSATAGKVTFDAVGLYDLDPLSAGLCFSFLDNEEDKLLF